MVNIIRPGLALLLLVMIVSASAAEDPIPLSATEEEVVSYPAGFFARYQPLTALDMVEQVPGFQLNDGADKRGFGGAAGNILINDRRPSAKQDLPSAILARIPASLVQRIDLIRGQVQGLELQGYAVVANVHLREDLPAAVRWEGFLLQTDPAPLGFGGSVSVADRWRWIDYNAGLDVQREATGITGRVDVFDGSGELTEVRADEKQESGLKVNGLFLNASSWLGDTFLQLNSRLGYFNSTEEEGSLRLPRGTGEEPRDIRFREELQRPDFELGLDGERLLNPDLIGKAILLFSHNDQDLVSTQTTLDLAGDIRRFRRVDEESDATEAIGRLEFDWAAIPAHAVQASFEVAFNALDNRLLQTDDTGSAPVVVDVPNANARVEELRGDVLLRDTWSPGNWTLDYGLGAEVSEITQTGDTEQQRRFFFFKPQALVSYSPGQGQQTRLRLAREVAQLDFSDFVSATVFVDDDLALGNPDLEPESTWVAELAHEWRFGELGVVTLTGFHHWVSDVEDLLPITDEFEAPGNIGDGRRWGLELEGTLPLARLGLSGARLDLRARWRDSTVTDPVTGEPRRFSAAGAFPGTASIDFENENAYVVDVAYRQDFREAGWAWGWDAATQPERRVYRVNELGISNEGVELNAFIETTRWWGVKMRLEGRNLLDYTEIRDRITYAGRRDLSPVDTRELRARPPARIFILSFSGSF